MGFEGTVILVSHDRRFLENVTDPDRATCATAWPTSTRGASGTTSGPRGAAEGGPKGKTVTAKTARRHGSGRREGEARRRRASSVASTIAEEEEAAFESSRPSIAAGEKDLDALRGKTKASPGDDWEKLAKMAQEEQALTKKVDSMLLEWARLSEEVK